MTPVSPIHPFALFGAAHLVVLGTLLILGVILAWTLGHLEESSRVRLGKLLGLVLLGYVVAAYGRQGYLGLLNWRDSLPLHLCNWVLIACLVTLFHPNQLASEIAYFWGLTGTIQALLTPDLRQGFPSWPFFQFFWGHGVIILAIIFLIFGRNFRPRPGSVLRMFVAINIYTAVVGSLNYLFDWNYGYLCHRPSQPSLIDHLGPWPWYILSMEAIAASNFWILDRVWRIRTKSQPK
jgi:hypothetical integral membrane protein (TIGR02206 family)